MAEGVGAAAGPRVTLVIVSYNTRGLLERCLGSVFDHAGSMAIEVHVIDNASLDGSADAVASRWPSVKLTRNLENRGYAPACNQGLREARTPYVLALNSDALLHEGSLQALVAHLEALPAAGAVGPRLLNADGSTQWVCARRAPRLTTSLLLHSQITDRLPGLLGFALGTYDPSWYERAGDVEVLSGACILFRRRALDDVGVLEDRLVLNYDDVEWCMRARRRGVGLRYEPAAEVTHLGGASRAFDPESNSAANIRSFGVFWDLAFSRPAAAALKLSLLFRIGLSLLKNLVLAPFVSMRRSRAAHLVRLLGQCASTLLHPSVSFREGEAWRRGTPLGGEGAPPPG